MSASPEELLDLIATQKDTLIEQGEQIEALTEQVALLSEAITKPAGYAGQEPNV